MILLFKFLEFSVKMISIGMKKKLSSTYDSNLVSPYLHVFNGRVGDFKNKTKVPVSESVEEAIRSLQKRDRWHKVNSRALLYFLDTLSMTISEITSPFSSRVSLESLMYDDEVMVKGKFSIIIGECLNSSKCGLIDLEVIEGDKINYVANFRFAELMN